MGDGHIDYLKNRQTDGQTDLRENRTVSTIWQTENEETGKRANSQRDRLTEGKENYTCTCTWWCQRKRIKEEIQTDKDTAGQKDSEWRERRHRKSAK